MAWTELNERGGYQGFESYRDSTLDCNQTSFRVPETWYEPIGGIKENWATIFDYLNQVFDCMMKKFTSTELQIKRLVTDQLELREKLGQLTKR